MSIQVNDFRWEPGKNDAEYIKLLESSRDERQRIAQKAIAKLKMLSKAQEPVEPDIEGNVEYDGYGSWWHVCGACRQPIDMGDKFCRWCGRAVKWE